MSKIARFEALAERLVEGTFARLFAGRISPLVVATHLARAMEDQQTVDPDGTPQAPTHFWVYLNPDDCDALAVEQPTLEQELASHVAEMAGDAGLALHAGPVIQVLSSQRVEPHEVQIEARWLPGGEIPPESTREMDSGELATEAEATGTLPGRPFLILEGQRHTNLLAPIVSIGRALDNDVIVEDPRVSRHHAQLRRRYGRYVLYDLGSTGGTQINGYPVEECVLHTGDVLSLAGVQIVYGEDPPTPVPPPGTQDTPAFPHQEDEPG